MERKMTIYPAIFTKNKNGYTIEFIDLEGCITEGTNLQEAFYMAKDALGLYLDEEINFPKPTTDFTKIKLNKNQFINYIAIDMDEYREKYNNDLMSKNLTIPTWLNTIANKNHINFSQTLVEALKNKLEID